MGLLQRLDTHVKILLEGSHDAFILRALHIRHRRDHVKFGAPGIGEVGGDLERLQTPLGFIRADGHFGDGVVQMHQIAIVVGVRHDHDRTIGVGRQAGAGGSQQTLRQAALATIADDDQIVVARQFDEHRCRISRNDQRRGLDALLIGDGLGLRQNLLSIAVCRVVIAHRRIRGVERHRRVARQRVRANDLQRQSSMLRIVRCPPCGLVAGVGTINANENCLVVNHGRPP